MRPVIDNQNARSSSRLITAGLPAAVIGSIALALTASPAHAETRPVDERLLRVVPPKVLGAVGVTSKIPATKAPAAYTVQRGDTISAIASKFGLRTVDVLALNGLTWRSTIYPGQVITLVGGSAAAAPSTPAKAAAPASASYVVTAGDTISAIASRHGVSIQAVLAANQLGWSSIIYPGQKLAIPGKVLASVPASSPAPAPAPAAPAPAPAPAGAYEVKAGDTISTIASRHGVSIQAVLGANGLGWSSIIYPGQKLTIPAKGSGSAAGLDSEQVGNATLIIQIGRELGVPDRGIAIALGTSMQESWLRNLDWGDRDSLGLFQQRPSTGWGTAAQVRDKVRSIKAFYGGSSDPNGANTRGLLDIPGWQKMSYTDAAQAVQISAYPDRYAQWEKPAFAWLAALG
ncbi:LysM peptidoglycan-binding domain-containing protein [Microbacterium sp. CFBP9034]|nr:LysM peptidoglycan-binding domain-containing protein [Microbacterium sp. CFBP9034]MDY0910005.1 LysM peptidoglycan-binding domain-containing protein [Microbacterium sp. CFBP9034]